MNNFPSVHLPQRQLRPVLVFAVLLLALALACRQSPTTPAAGASGDDTFFPEKNAQHNGDYLATFPLNNPDSCLLRVKTEVPAKHQSWACQSIWYRIPRNQPAVSLRWLDLYEKNYPHDTVSAFAQMARGEFMVQLNKNDSARLLLADARARYLKLGRVFDASDADYLIGQCYGNERNYAKSIEAYLGVWDMLNRYDTTFSHRHASICSDLATVFATTKDFKQAIFWSKKIWYANPAKLDPAWRYKARAANRLSTYFAQVSQFDSSLYMCQRAIELFKANSKNPLPAELLYRLGFAYWKKGDCATALAPLQQASRVPATSVNPVIMNQTEQLLAETFTCLGKVDSAEFYLRKALASTTDTLSLATGHDFLAKNHAQRGRFREAFEAEREGLRLYKIAFQIEKATALSEAQARYETAELAHRVERLETATKISRQRGQIFGLMGLLAVVVLGGLFFRQRARRRILEQEKILLAQEKALAQADAERQSRELEQAQAHLQSTRAELDTATQLLQLKNQLIEELQLRGTRTVAQNLAPHDEAENVPSQAEMHQMKILTDQDWKRFRARFDELFPGLTSRVRVRFPDLTGGELRLFLLLKLRFNTTEIAETLGISVDSVYRNRNRLTQSLGLGSSARLDEFVRAFG